MGGFTEGIERLVESGMSRLSKEGGPLGSELVDRLTKYDGAWRQLAGPELERIKQTPNLSPQVREAGAKTETSIAKAIASHQQLGAKDSEIKRIIETMHSDPKIGPGKARHAWEVAQHYVKRPIYTKLFHSNIVEGMSHSSAEDAANWWHVNTKLSLAPLAHSVQAFNVPLLTGFGPAIKGLAAALRDPGAASELTLTSGAAVEDLIRQWHQEASGEILTGITRRVMKPVNFLVNAYKGWGSASAPYMLQDLQEGLQSTNKEEVNRSLRYLKLMEVDPKELFQRGYRDPNLIATTARRISDVAYADTNVLTVPSIWRMNPYMRTFTMFKPFAFKQAKFLYDNVFKEAFKHGNYKPLMVMAATYPIMSTLGATARSMIREGSLDPQIPKWDKDHWLDRVAWSLSQIGGAGIFLDAMSAMGGTYRGAPISFFLGPVVGGGVETAWEVADAINSKHPYVQIKKDVERELTAVPWAGPGLYKNIHGKSNVQKMPFPKKQMMQGYLTKHLNKIISSVD